MDHLRKLYEALKERAETLYDQQEEEPLNELRLDVEQLIQLICQENGYQYDQDPDQENPFLEMISKSTEALVDELYERGKKK
jgi:hypothetical protein